MTDLVKRIDVAQGEFPADLAIVDAEVFNAFTGAFERKDVLVADGVVAALHPPCSDAALMAARRVEAKGRTLVPGFVDAHVHLESGQVAPGEYCALAAARGTTTLIADPHEISNVAGRNGLRYMLAATEKAAARVFFMLPSCVPSSHLETAGATLAAADLAPFLSHPRVLGLGEMMNYPGVLAGDPGVMEKMDMVRRYNEAAFGARQGLSVDGHAPGLEGPELSAYASAGIRNDHECSSAEEARARLALGMGVLLREGSAAKNLLALVPAVTEYTEAFCALCTDDRDIADLVAEGGINALVRMLVKDGRLPLPRILRLASLNAARLFGLAATGAVAPGFRADFALYPDRTTWQPDMVWLAGTLVAESGRPAPQAANAADAAAPLLGSVRLGATLAPESFRIPDTGRPVKCIDVTPGQLVTERLTLSLPGRNGFLEADPAQGVAKFAVLERHAATGNMGLGFARGLGILRGAVASTVAHDSHNLAVLGMNDADMLLAARSLAECGGGLAVCLDGRLLARLPLPIGGLLSDKPAQEVLETTRALAAAAAALGCDKEHPPFMTLAFLSLPVIPHLKLTDRGLVDVDAFAVTDIYA